MQPKGPTAGEAPTIREIIRTLPGGLRLTYRLRRSRVGIAHLEVLAEDEAGRRCERSGGLPEEGGVAEAFLQLAASAALTPYTLIEVYDEFIVGVTEKG